MSDSVERDLDRLKPGAPRRRVAHPLYAQFDAGRWTRASARAHLGIGPAEEVALFFGYVRHYKGLDILLSAWPRVRGRGMPASRIALIVVALVAGGLAAYFATREEPRPAVEATTPAVPSHSTPAAAPGAICSASTIRTSASRPERSGLTSTCTDPRSVSSHPPIARHAAACTATSRVNMAVLRAATPRPSAHVAFVPSVRYCVGAVSGEADSSGALLVFRSTTTISMLPAIVCA